jgi:8-oxo-dGTP diphosphatase
MPAAAQAPDKKRYQFIPRVLVFLSRGEDVLLIKGAPTKRVWPNLYNGLGGHVERGESIWQAAHREIQEESGLSAQSLWLCATVAINTGDAEAGILMFVFRGEAEGEMKASDEGGLEWVTPSRLPALEMVEDIPTLLPRIMALQPADAPIWGYYDYDNEGKLKIRFEDE